MELAKVNAHYQVTIPKSVRQKAKVRKGSYVKVDYRDGTIFIRPINPRGGKTGIEEPTTGGRKEVR